MLRNLFALILCGLSVGWMMGMSVSPVVQTVIASVLTLLIGVISLLAGIPDKSASSLKAEKSLTGTSSVETHVLGNVVTVLIAQPSPVQPLETEQPEPAPEDQTKPATTIALWPLAVFVVSLVIGATGGVFTRTNDLLGTDHKRFMTRWRAVMPVKPDYKDSVLLMSQLFYSTYGISPALKHDGNTPVNPDVVKTQGSTSTNLYNDYTTMCNELSGRSGDVLRKTLETNDDPLVKLIIAKHPTDAELGQIVDALCSRTSK